MKVEETSLPGVLLIEPRLFDDERGWFLESWQSERYIAAGLPELSVQDNLSFSRRGVLRGLHLQHPQAQAKLCQVVAGEVFDVAVDVRPDSPGFGRWLGMRLSGETHQQLFIPEGFAHGFVVLSETALFSYRCSTAYAPEHEHTIRWDDPELAIDWQIEEPIVSAKDRAGQTLAEITDKLR